MGEGMPWSVKLDKSIIRPRSGNDPGLKYVIQSSTPWYGYTYINYYLGFLVHY